MSIPRHPRRYLRTLWDFCVTILLWTYFILGYFLFFSPFYLFAYFLSRDRERAFQNLNHFFFKGFFNIIRVLVPRVTFHIQQEVLSVRGSVIVSNHRSYLDPILFTSLFPVQKTIVRSDFFYKPIFGWTIRTSGFLPSAMGGTLTDIMLGQVAGMKDYLASGGNLFIFPEGTRSRDGKIGPFDKGAFTLAKVCRVPIAVLFVRNTDRLFSPDRFLFNTGDRHQISVEWIGSIRPDYDSPSFSLSDLMKDVHTLMMKRNEKGDAS